MLDPDGQSRRWAWLVFERPEAVKKLQKAMGLGPLVLDFSPLKIIRPETNIRRAPDYKGVAVSNIPFNATERDVETCFNSYGVESLKMIWWR